MRGNTGVEPIGYNNARRLAQLRQALEAAESVARQLCTCPAAAPEAHPLLLKLDAIRAELDLLDSLTPRPSLPVPGWPYLFDYRSPPGL